MKEQNAEHLSLQLAHLQGSIEAKKLVSTIPKLGQNFFQQFITETLNIVTHTISQQVQNQQKELMEMFKQIVVSQQDGHKDFIPSPQNGQRDMTIKMHELNQENLMQCIAIITGQIPVTTPQIA